MQQTWHEHLREHFSQGFPAFCGFKVTRVGQGLFESALQVADRHRQQDGFVHAGVLATMADHTAGYASFTTVSEEFRILTVEFKINYLRPALGPLIVCRARVINSGQRIKVAEAEVYSVADGVEKLAAKGMFTQMAVAGADLQSGPGKSA
jgi:uncharacterized protein (TIGR00369 family)